VTQRTAPTPIRNRYAGQGGRYVVIDGETFPADEDGQPLPHRDEAPAAPAGQPTAPADSEPTP